MLKEPMTMQQIQDNTTRYYTDDYVVARPIIDGYVCYRPGCSADIFLAPTNIFACTNHHLQGEGHSACNGFGCDDCASTGWVSYPLVAQPTPDAPPSQS